MTEDEQLLRQYTRERSEPAFSELVNRHIDLVFSAALRVVGGDSHLAQDVTQMVFTDLARKAWGLPRDVVLAGWLYRHACFTAAKAVRTERRRQTREQTAMAMRTLDDHTEPDWDLIAPHLDEGLNQLSAADRDAIVLRFLKAQDLRAVGAALGVSEDAAQKRVSRALDKLRGVLDRRGVTLTSVMIASVLATHTVIAAPAGLAVSVSATSLTAAAAASSGFSLTLMKVMAMTKMQMTVAGVVLVAAVATPLVLQQQSLNHAREENNQLRVESQSLQAQADQVAALTAENQRLSNLVAAAEARRTSSVPDSGQANELLRLRSQVTRLQADATKTNDKASSGLAEALASPAMKGMMKSAFAATVDRTYAEFFSSAQLTPEQTTALKELILNKSLLGMDAALSSLSGKADPAKLREQASQAKTDSAAYDDQIKQLLGDDEFAKFQTFEKTKGERMAVSMLESQLPVGAELNSDQRSQMIHAMTEERQNFKFTADLSEKPPPGSDLSAYFNEGAVKRHLEEKEQLNQRYVARAREILRPEQVKVYEQYLANQQQMEAASIEMSKALFAPKATGQ